MTHTLHRKGTAESLKKDFVILCTHSLGINDKGSEAKIRKCLSLAMRYDPKNIGSIAVGNMFTNTKEEVLANAAKNAHAVFDNQESMTEVLRELKEADLGMSVIVSGIIDSVKESCQKVGLKLHTVESSLGIWGKTEKLPPEKTLEITTMCGHGVVSANSVKAAVEDIKKGVKSPEEAAIELTSLCFCGIFNPVRTARLLGEMAEKEINA